MEGLWPIIFLAVVLKIPVLFGLWLVWWASRGGDEFAADEEPGAEDHGFRRWRRSPKPQGPRRGPHGGTAVPLPDCPPGGRNRTPAIKPRVAPGVAPTSDAEMGPVPLRAPYGAAIAVAAYWLLAGLVLAGPAQASPAPTHYPVGEGAIFVATGDFDGDGNQDVAVANTSEDTVSVLLGSATGALGTKSDFSVGDRPRSIAVGHFNADLDLDLAVVNGDDDNVSILLGSTGGSFTSGGTLAVGDGPTSVVAADFDGDLAQDLAVSNLGSGDVSIHLSTGPGTFGAAATSVALPGPHMLAVDDLNADDDPDLAVSVLATSGTSRLSVLLGSGPMAATFEAPANYPVPNSPQGVVSGLFNGDAVPDLAVLTSENRVRRFLGTGTGAFGAPAAVEIDGTTGLVAADFNSDSNEDLASTGFVFDDVSIASGDGTGAFGPPVNSVVHDGPYNLAAADFNDDAVPDLAVANASSNDVSILLSDSGIDTGVRPTPWVNYGVGQSPLTITGQPVAFEIHGAAPAGTSIQSARWDFDGNGVVDQVTTGVTQFTGGFARADTVYAYPNAGTFSPRYSLVSNTGDASPLSAPDQIIEIRPGPPAGPLGVTINNAAQYTNDPNVVVNPVWLPLAERIVISNDGGFGSAVTLPIGASVPWTLDSSGPERLPKTIYVRFQGGPSGGETYQDDIILDETAPRITSATLSDGAGASAVGAIAVKAAGVKLLIRAKDATSGVSQMQVTRNRKKAGRWQKYRTRVPVGSASRVYVRVQDRAGNVSKWRRAR